VVEHQGRQHRIGARGGVILAAGGFDHDMELRRRHLPVLEKDWSFGNPASMGDGIRAGEKVAPWRNAAVIPLRSVRRALKSPNFANETALVPAATTEFFRTRIKAVELEAERLQQEAMHELARASPLGRDVGSTEAAARTNVEAYAAVVHASLPQRAVETLLAAEVPVAPVKTIPEVAKDPHLWEREMLVKMEDAVAGEMYLPGATIKMSKTPGGVAPVPTPGQHTDEILADWGFEAEEVEALRSAVGI